MSGGVDSSVAAALLLREGYEVVGCFMRLGSPGESLDAPTPDPGAAAACDPRTIRVGHQGCCSINDAADARLVAAELGIPFYICNFKKNFARIIDYFADEYAAGRTPNPCVRCNDWLKFGALHEYARGIDAHFVASGHYARIDRSRSAQHRLMRGVDRSKDQSYVLFGAPRERLARMLLPIGEHEKPAVRDLARRFGLPVFDKPDSQEICFVPDNDYASLVEGRRPALAREGPIVDAEGREVGRHAGHHHFTIGQRRGVRVALGYPVYVVGKDPRTNTVTVGARERLTAEACVVGEANWLLDPRELEARFTGWARTLVKCRYNSEVVPAEVRLAGEDEAPTPSGRRGVLRVRFERPQEAVTPGQALVVYDADEPDWVLGGGGFPERLPAMRSRERMTARGRWVGGEERRWSGWTEARGNFPVNLRPARSGTLPRRMAKRTHSERNKSVSEQKTDGAEPRTTLPNPRRTPRWSGVPTFCRFPMLNAAAPGQRPVDWAIYGAPFDGGVTYRPGARFGPVAAPGRMRDAHALDHVVELATAHTQQRRRVL
ncbi:MAG: tRNA 2-thiouridine(34) synthase MnmA, partial [Deltaproteobacteria bacterium HGW-Deltaproteobacteria-17]